MQHVIYTVQSKFAPLKNHHHYIIVKCSCFPPTSGISGEKKKTTLNCQAASYGGYWQTMVRLCVRNHSRLNVLRWVPLEYSYCICALKLKNYQ